ncbi:hypothetical protein [Rhodoferax aquaticus]|uniref:Uncharacterized protein n=1 Tax=Rhodoferax aquaticus TaxID=2527691 RepID=A0A515EJA5_9BURK|nr:hypothetical protein [Rhodoferax aquaticus]QDL52754.1 hypothetical protein EXZ61_00390 [Rhodoferax aquaticus]
MMRLLITLLCLVSPLSAAFAVGPPLAQKPLLLQIQRLTDLLRDSQAVGYPNATMAQAIELQSGRQLVLAVFTIEGFGGGNNHSQFLAAFETDTETKPTHYRLLDVIKVAGKGWRGIEKLNARVLQAPKSQDIRVEIDALEVGPDDPPNFPSIKTVVRLVISKGRLTEIESKSSP